MSKIVLIQANPPPGFHHHGEAHRLWPAATPVKVEILDQEEDPPEVPVKRRRNGEETIDLGPDPNRIGARSFRALQANPRIRILSDADSVTSAEVTAAKAQTGKLEAENSFLRSEVSNLETENDILKARILELERAAGISPSARPRPTAEQGVTSMVPGVGDVNDGAGNTQVDAAGAGGAGAAELDDGAGKGKPAPKGGGKSDPKGKDDPKAKAAK
jgi:hypothetical protein